MYPIFKHSGLGFLLSVVLTAAGPAPGRPWESSAVNIETGLLWATGHSTPFSYQLVPTQLSWRSREFLGRALADGSRIVVRHRLTLLGTWLRHGPESHYVGFAGSPSVEWWDRTGSWSLFTGVGGGFGLIDSRGIPGGQGQDFTLNWFMRGGIEHVIKRNGRLSAGLMYQHMSNGGRTNPNPGIDAVGLTFGYGWAY